ncbi:mitochondrial 54S ribosomal protein bL31m [Magnusiomyces paraingens]|uniref:Ribosomal protein bL31m N-terminal domain-containing protein n=1 Tax=Magnusiomyces paraingens TaxID=2606893 RepID=A0A5E8C1A8_9ASCO|nr:uncharacterized protein SAPINGB_P005690 [Saprochaete ingens]VVT57427.1 unnamed protein product [Saprochaete ingens]
MLTSLLNNLRPGYSSILKNGINLSQTRNYAIPGSGRSVLTRRAKRKLIPGKTRPSIFHMFECKVELSDGSTYVRRSQYPRVEWRYLADQRNHPLYNPSRSNLKVVEADATGRLAKFKQKYGFVQPVDSADKKDATEKNKSDEKSGEFSKPAIDDYLDLMSEGYVPVQSGGKLAKAKRGKK